MAIKVKELNDDAVIDVQVNKNYYLMMKSTLFYLFQQIENIEEREKSLEKVMSGKFEDMNDWERSFHTISLFLAEVEKQASMHKLYIEKELLEPGDEGYKEPTLD